MLKQAIKKFLLLFFPGFYKKRIFRNLANFSWENAKEIHLDPELLLLQDLLTNTDDTFFDIGANKGEFCFMAEKLIAQKNIFAFEPNPALFNILKRVFPEIRLYSIAISDKTGSASFKIPVITNKTDDTLGTLETDYLEKNETSRQMFSVGTSTFDDFIQQQNIQKISLIKIDVEGHETKVVNGAQQTIQRFRPDMVIEIEQRHHANTTISSLLKSYLEIGYSACYFSFSEFKLLEISNTELVVQNFSDWGTRNYMNNFIFIHNKERFSAFISKVNKKAAQHKT